MTSSMVPMLDDQGNPGFVPRERVQEAIKAGGKVGFFVEKDGTTGIIPAERLQDALSAGAKISQANQGPTQFEQERNRANQPGILHSMASEAGNIVTGIPKAIGNAARMMVDPTPAYEAAKAIAQQDAQRKASGRSTPYRAVAALGSAVGANASGMEQAADVGNWRGVLGTAATDAAAPAVAARIPGIVGKVAPRASEALNRAALLGKTPEEAYASALKPSTALSEADRAAIVKTGLQEEIPVSKGGLQKIADRIDDLNQAIKDTIAKDPNRPISPAAAVKNLRAVEQRFGTQVNPQADLEAIAKSGQEFLDQFRSVPGGAVRNMTAAEAQAMKQGTYRVLGDKAYGELKSASVEAQKGIARGLKEELANAFPELKTQNAALGNMLDLEPVLERAVNRIGNHQLIGIGTPITTGAVKAVTGSGKLAGAAGVVKAVLDNPMVKSRLAIAIAKGGRTSYASALARVESYQASLGYLGVAPRSTSNADSPPSPSAPPQ